MSDTNSFSLSVYLKKFGINNKGSFPSGWALLSNDPIQTETINWPSSNIFLSLTGIPIETKQQPVTNHLEPLQGSRVLITDVSIIPGQRYDKETQQKVDTIEIRAPWKKIFALPSNSIYNRGTISGKLIALSNQGSFYKLMIEQSYMIPNKKEWKTRQIPCLLPATNISNLKTNGRYTFFGSRIIQFDDKFVVEVNPDFILENASNKTW